MAVNGPQMIGAVLEHLRPEDVELLLANRGLPSVGAKEELIGRLQNSLQAEICEWEWETGDVPEFHCGKLSHNAALQLWTSSSIACLLELLVLQCTDESVIQKQLLPFLAIQRAISAATLVENTMTSSLQRWWEQGLAWQHTTTVYMCLVAWMKKGLSTCTCGSGTSAVTLALNLSHTGQLANPTMHAVFAIMVPSSKHINTQATSLMTSFC